MGDDIKTVYGTQKTIQLAITAIVAAHKPVLDIQTKRVALFWYVATIKTTRTSHIV